MAGDLDANGLSTDLTVEPISAYTRTIGVKNASADPVTLTVPTQLSATRWQEILATQEDTKYVEDFSRGPRAGTVNITLAPTTHYELRIARLEVRATEGVSNSSEPDPRYLVGLQEGVLTEGEDGRAKVTVEVRDRFNNKKSNANVMFNASVGNFESRGGSVLGSPNATVKPGENGQATIWYNASVFGIQDVEVYLGDEVNNTLSPEKRLTYQVRTTGSDGGGIDGSNSDGGLFLFIEDIQATPGSDSITWKLNNTGSQLNLTGVQLAFVTTRSQAGNQFEDGPNAIENLIVDGSSRIVNVTEQLRPDFFSDNPLSVPSGAVDIVTSFDEPHSSKDKDAVFVRYHLYFEGGISATFDQVVFVQSG